MCVYRTIGLMDSGRVNISVCNKSPRSTQPSIPPGWVNRVPLVWLGLRLGCVHLCRVAGVIPYGKRHWVLAMRWSSVNSYTLPLPYLYVTKYRCTRK